MRTDAICYTSLCHDLHTQESSHTLHDESNTVIMTDAISNEAAKPYPLGRYDRTVTNDSRCSKQRARHSANEQAACSLMGSIEQLVKIIILNRRSSMAERCRCVRCTITELSKQREAAQVKIMIDWCNLRRPLQCAGTTWNDVVELSCCAIGVALCSPAPPDSPSATVQL